MRTHILAALALMVPACAGEISSTGGGGDDGAAVCGNGQVEAGEQCDDGNAIAGDGCSATCQTEVATPALAMTVDKPTITTELMTSNAITVTLTGTGGFAGDVNLTAAVMDGANAPITDWTTTFDHATVTVPSNGTATAVLTLMIPSENKALLGNVQISASTSVSGVTVAPKTSAVTAANQVSFLIGFDANVGCVYPTGLNSTNPVKITVGSKVRFVNMAQTANTAIAIHSNAAGPSEGICHEAQPNTNGCPNGDTAGPATINPNEAYEQTATAAGAPFSWYCHSPGIDLGNGDPFIQVVN